jgi:hypothetical protein
MELTEVRLRQDKDDYMDDYIDDNIDDHIDDWDRAVISTDEMASVSTTFGFDDYGIDRGIKVLIISMIIIWMMLMQKNVS